MEKYIENLQKCIVLLSEKAIKPVKILVKNK